jgi:cytochrome c2
MLNVSILPTIGGQMRNLAACVLVGFFLVGCTFQTGILPLSAVASGQQTASGDPERGTQLFREGIDDAPPCSACHQTVEGSGLSLGPNLAGIASRASTRIHDIIAEDYLRASILEPGAYVVSGYRNIMYPDYAAHLSSQDVADLIAFLLTLDS